VTADEGTFSESDADEVRRRRVRLIYHVVSDGNIAVLETRCRCRAIVRNRCRITDAQSQRRTRLCQQYRVYPPRNQTLSSSIETRNIGIRATLHLHSNLASLPSIENQSLYKYTTNALRSVLIEALLETGNCSGCCRSRRRGR
jgi:hypothetical protein